MRNVVAQYELVVSASGKLRKYTTCQAAISSLLTDQYLPRSINPAICLDKVHRAAD
jgi:hypothetical protein